MYVRKILCLMFFVISAGLCAQSTSVSISFAELDDYVRSKSPVGKIISSNYELTVLDGKSALQWSNPELEAEYESLSNNFDTDRESSIAIGKEFTAPWVRSIQKSSIKENVLAAENEMKSHALQAVAQAKSAYVELELMRQRIAGFERFQGIIKRASTIANDRNNAGTMSGLDNQLVQLSLFNLDARLLQLRHESRELETKLCNYLGVADNQKLLLSTAITFVAVNLDQNEYYTRLRKSPAYVRFQHLHAAKEKQVRVEKSRVFPALHISGGYKNVNDDFRGYVVGVSMPVPLLNWNRPQIQHKQIERSIVGLEFDLYKSSTERSLEAKFVAAQELSKLLSDNQQQFRKAYKLVADLVFSFEEGRLELGDVLDGIQVYSESLSNYYEQLYNYYQNIFDIEVMVAETIINF